MARKRMPLGENEGIFVFNISTAINRKGLLFKQILAVI